MAGGDPTDAPRGQFAIPAGEARFRVAMLACASRVLVAIQPGTQLRK
jgi:hypothetical protein